MKNEKDPLEVIYAVILTAERRKAIQTYQRINSKWPKTEFHKRVYQALGQLIKSDKNIDMMTLALQFRENNWNEKGVSLAIAKLTDAAYDIEARIYLNSCFLALKNQECIDAAVQFTRTFQQLVQSDNMTVEKFYEIRNNLNEIDFDIQEKTKTNAEFISEVILDHENATKGISNGLEIGYKCLNGVILLEPVDVMVIGARPAMGKTAFAVSTLCKLAQKGKHVVFFSLEMSTKQIMRRILANLSGIDSNDIKYGRCNQEQVMALARLSFHSIFDKITIIEGTQSVNDIGAHIARLTAEKKIDVFIVDYLQKVQPSRNKSRYEAVTEVSNGIKLISQTNEVPCIALAQLSRDSSKTGKRPSLPDLKESGEIEQDASVVCFLHRPEYYGEDQTIGGNPSQNVCELLIGKNREGELGAFELFVNLSTSKFEYEEMPTLRTAVPDPF